MRFTKQDYDYLSGKLFSSGYELKLEGNPICARNDKIIEIVKGASCLHVGCCDHIPLIAQKVASKNWLHGLLEENCRYVLGVDINQAAVDYVNQSGFAVNPVYCADVTSPDFTKSIPPQSTEIDYILLGEIIEHVDDPVSFLRQLDSNMCKIGFHGTYVITVPNAFCMLRPGKYAAGVECVNSDHRYWFTPYTIAKILFSAGILPTELWFANSGRYEIEKSYQSDQIIITGFTQESAAILEANTATHVELLEHMISSGDLSGALDHIETLSQCERQNWQIQNLTGVICSYCGQFKEAATFFEAALEKQPDDAEILYNLAETYAALGKNKEVWEILERCCQHTDNEELMADIAALRQRVTERKGKRILMIAYYFPPLSGSGVFRSLKFAKYLPQFGWQPTVISTDMPPKGWNFADESLISEIPEGMEVIRIPDGVSTGRETTVDSDRAQSVLGFLRDVLRHSPEADEIFSLMLRTQQGKLELFTFPCMALSWAHDVVQYIEKNIDVAQFDVVYTTSGPKSAHLVGFHLKQKYGITWVADYRDPWTFNPYGDVYDPSEPQAKTLFELESVLLHQADCSLTVAPSLAKSYMRHFRISKEKIASITNGYDEADFTGLSVPMRRTHKFTINYSGLLYTQQRSITPILNAIQQLRDENKIDLSKIQFRIVGKTERSNIEAVKQYGLEEIICHTGYLSHRQALQANLDADMLLLLVGDEPEFKPVYTGKIFEYLRSGRPILALAPKDGVVDQILKESGHGEAFLSTQISEIKAMILREYRRWEKGEISELLHSPVIEQFERKALTKQLSDVLSVVVEQRGSLQVSCSGAPISRGPKYLVICNGGYPIEGNPRCMFAHERVLQYIKAGLNVDAFGFIWDAPLAQYEFEGVHVTQGGASVLRDLLQKNHYEKLLIHFADLGVMYAIQEAGKLNMPMIVWCHGYEVSPWYRCWFNYTSEELQKNRAALNQQNEERKKFLRQIYGFDNIHFVFVSEWLMKRSEKYVGTLPKRRSVIHNFINHELFESPDKRPEDRFRILSIKNHAAKTYANDLTAKAIIELSERPWFSELTFDLYGRGQLFEENFGELMKRNYPNVHIHKEFLSHEKMRELFRSNGIFLSPTRMDSHQVTTSEAMSAGLPVITSSAGPIREFMDEDCGSLFEFDNYWMMAEEIEYLYYHPEEFLRKSKNAVQRIRTQCGYDQTIGRELQLITKT